MVFSDDLVFTTTVFKSINYDFEKIQDFRIVDQIVYYQAKEKMTLCEFAPLIVEKNVNTGSK
jgi:hypothetical protein